MNYFFRILRHWFDVLFKKREQAPTPGTPTQMNIEIPLKPKLNLNISLTGSRPWKGIVVHHSASPDGKTRDWDGIVKYHTSFRIDFESVSQESFEKRLAAHDGKVFQKPWAAVGYHIGTENVNGEPVFNWGRPLSMIGAHAGVEGVSNRFNEDYLGLCCIGNYDAASPDPKLWDFNIQVTRALMTAFHIPVENVIGHREVFDQLGVPRQKTCPGKMWNLELFRKLLAVG